MYAGTHPFQKLSLGGKKFHTAFKKNVAASVCKFGSNLRPSCVNLV